MSTNQTVQPSVLTLLIVEDHKLASECLKLGFEKYPDIHVLGQAYDGLNAVRMAKELKPDIILMDISLPQKNGIEATREIKAVLPETRIIIISSLVQKDAVKASFNAKADAYCTKETDLEQLVHMIRAVSQGAVCLDPKIAQFLINEIQGLSAPSKVDLSPPSVIEGLGGMGLETTATSFLASKAQTTKTPVKTACTVPVFSESPVFDEPISLPSSLTGKFLGKQSGGIKLNLNEDDAFYKARPIDGKIVDHLQPREIEILKLIAENRNNEEISRSLGLNTSWLSGYIKNILLKLSVDNEVQAVQRALQEGLIKQADMLYQD